MFHFYNGNLGCFRPSFGTYPKGLCNCLHPSLRMDVFLCSLPISEFFCEGKSAKTLIFDSIDSTHHIFSADFPTQCHWYHHTLLGSRLLWIGCLTLTVQTVDAPHTLTHTHTRKKTNIRRTWQMYHIEALVQIREATNELANQPSSNIGTYYWPFLHHLSMHSKTKSK